LLDRIDGPEGVAALHTLEEKCSALPPTLESQTHRVVLVGQLRLLLQRAERGIGLDRRSINNLLRLVECELLGALQVARPVSARQVRR